MTQEEKQLLLKDLCVRLPYGVKVTDGLHIIELKVRIDTAPATLAQFINSDNVKYYLRPMSSMTEEEYKELSYHILQQPDLELVRSNNFDMNSEEAIRYIDWLNKHMFDYRGLIELGLALEAPKDMYLLKPN